MRVRGYNMYGTATDDIIVGTGKETTVISPPPPAEGSSSPPATAEPKSNAKLYIIAAGVGAMLWLVFGGKKAA